MRIINELLVKNAVHFVLFKYNTRHVAYCKLQEISTSQYIVYHIRNSWSDLHNLQPLSLKRSSTRFKLARQYKTA